MKSLAGFINSAVSETGKIHDYHFADLIDAKMRDENCVLDTRDKESLSLIIAILRIRLTPANEGGPFSPIYRLDDERSLLPEDLDEDDAASISELAPLVDSPTIRARLYDVAFVSGERGLGRAAVQTYNELIRRITSGDYDLKSEAVDAPAMDAMPLLLRMVQIDRNITKGRKLSARSIRTIQDVCDLAEEKRDFFRYANSLELALTNGVIGNEECGDRAVSLARSGDPSDYPMAIKACFEFAARAFGEQHAEKRDDALLEAAKCSLAMADQNPQAMAKASWTKTAISEIERVGGHDQWLHSLKSQLRDFQAEATSEMASFEIKLTGLVALRRRSKKYFAEADLPDALREVALHLWPKKIDETKGAIDEISAGNVFDKIVSSAYMDHRGRTTSHGLDPTEHWGTDEYYKERATRDLAIERRYQIAGVIEPAREALFERFSFAEYHMYPLLLNSVFVPQDRRPIFSAGLAHLWQGNYLIASHLLVPQIENSLRHLLEQVGIDHAVIKEDGLESDRSLSALINKHKTALAKILPDEILWEIDLLFNFRPGPAFRHELTHGNLPYGAFYGDMARVATWFCYFLVCVFALGNWDKQVRPMYRRVGLV